MPPRSRKLIATVLSMPGTKAGAPTFTDSEVRSETRVSWAGWRPA